jgi:predicted transposase/invertase (TIGR01784 family)
VAKKEYFCTRLRCFKENTYLYAKNLKKMAKSKKKNKKTDKEKKSSTPGVFMNIKTDYGFKRVFGNKVLLIAFVNTLSILPEPIVDVEYLPVEQLGYSEKNRRAVYDVYVKTSNGQHFIIEMQIAGQKYFADRMLFYAGYSTIGQAPKGKITTTDKQGKTIEKNWNYKIDGVYMITILDFVMFKEKKAKNIVIEYVEMIRRKANLVFTKKFELAIIELPKFKKSIEELSNITDKWLYSITHIEELTSCPEVMANDEIMKELYETARINKLTNEEMDLYKQSVIEYDDVRDAMEYVKEEAFAEGIVKGEKRGIVKGEKRGIVKERNRFVKNLYSINWSLKQIAEFTGLTEKKVFEIIDKS